MIMGYANKEAGAVRTVPVRIAVWRQVLPTAIVVICTSFLLSPGSSRADTRLLAPIHESQSLIIENNNLSAADFRAAYLSKNIAERRYAEMYLLGVIDSSEGIEWCSYRSIQTITVDEAVFTGFKRLDTGKLKMRVSSVIKEILSNSFPCKGRK
jgi:hypothetical protein